MTSGIAWAIGWAVTAGIGVALEAGWPVFGLSGALVSQVIAGVVALEGLAQDEAAAFALAHDDRGRRRRSC